MQCPIDPREQSGLLAELISGGMTALVAERIVEPKGERMPTVTEPHTHSARASSGAPGAPETHGGRGVPGRLISAERQARPVATPEQNKSTVRQFDELTRTGDPHDLEPLCTPDMVNHALRAGRAAGFEGTREFLAECRRDPGRDRWMRSKVHRDEYFVAENDLVAQFAVVEGIWPGGTFRGIETKPGRYATDVAFMYRLVDGRIAERWAVRDDLGMMRQLGAIR